MTRLPRVSRRDWLAALVLWLAGARAPGAAAQARRWPTRPVRLLLAYPPGGASDAVARALAQLLTEQLGVAVRVEHRAGAGGAVAIQALARATPDGHTLVFAAITALSRVPAADPNVLPVAPVAAVMQTPVLVVGTPALKAVGFREMLAQARTPAASIRWATTGEGTTGHRVLEVVRRASGASITHVPYKGGGQQINDALAGQFEVLSTNVAALQLAAIRSRRLQPLAVGAPARLAVLPDVPTLAELGYPQANLASLFGVFAPAGTPPAVIESINAAVGTALRDHRLRSRLLAIDNVPAQGSASDFTRQIAEQGAADRPAR